MKFKLNNKGYMLVEIILASAIAFGLAFFIIDLTIKLKNKNDDLMVETLMNTDRTIINNKLMSYAKEEESNFNCNNLKINKATNTITYNDNVIDTVNAYGIIDWDKMECSTDNGKISIKIPIDIPQMPDKEYDIIFDYKYEIGDMTDPTCSLVTDGTTIKATYSDNEGGSGIAYYGWDPTYTGDNSDSKAISVGTHTYYVKDRAGNENFCSIEVVQSKTTYTCSKAYDTCSVGQNYKGACYIYNSYNIQSYPSNNSCNHNCCGVCVAEECQYCSIGTYTTAGCRIFYSNYNDCNNGTKKNGACYQEQVSSCSSDWNVYETYYTCDNEYQLTSDNKYCYK